MANHFRSSERQGDDRLDSTSPQVPQADAVQGDGSFDPQSHVDAIAREEAANVRSTAAHAAPVAQAPADPAPQAPADAEPLQPVTTVTAHTPEDAPRAPQGEGLVVSQTAGDIESQPETKSVFAPLQDDGNRVVPHTGRPTISLRNATLIYPAQPNKPALDGVSLDIYPGDRKSVV